MLILKHNGINLIGDRFGRWTVVELIKSDKKGQFYLCKCDCGKENIVRYSTLNNGESTSCGCFAKENSSKINSKPRGERSFNNTYYMYKRSAKERGLEFNLTKEKFRELTSKDCWYCNKKPSSFVNFTQVKTGFYIYNGIDRIDNNKGYIEDNMVTCCEYCNRMKLDLSLEDFKNHIYRICSNFLLKENIKDNNEL